MIPRKIFSLFSLRLASNIDRAIIDHGSLLMDLGESSFLALATAESSVCLRRGQKNPHQTVIRPQLLTTQRNQSRLQNRENR